MKKFFVSAAVILLSAALMASCSDGQKNDGAEDETKPSVTTARDGFEDVTAPPEITEESTDDTAANSTVGTSAEFGAADAVDAARSLYGDVDGETGYRYSYSFDEMINENGTEYYKIRVSWYIEETEHYSLCGYLLVSADGTVREYY